jgi:hypothetical protein
LGRIFGEVFRPNGTCDDAAQELASVHQHLSTPNGIGRGQYVLFQRCGRPGLQEFDRNCQHLAFIYNNGFVPNFVEKMNSSVFINVRNNTDPDMLRQDLVLQSITYDNVHTAAVLASANLDEGKHP